MSKLLPQFARIAILARREPADIQWPRGTLSCAPSLDTSGTLLPAEVHADSPRPDTPRPPLVEMREACELPDDLLGGNPPMRKECKTWLPKEEVETDCNNRVRVSRSARRMRQ